MLFRLTNLHHFHLMCIVLCFHQNHYSVNVYLCYEATTETGGYLLWNDKTMCQPITETSYVSEKYFVNTNWNSVFLIKYIHTFDSSNSVLGWSKVASTIPLKLELLVEAARIPKLDPTSLKSPFSRLVEFVSFWMEPSNLMRFNF